MSHDVARAGLLDFSPTFNPPSFRSGDKTNKENNVSAPVLSLVQFSRSPFVTFGSVKLGSSKSLPLRIENPSEDAVATVTVDKISSSKGFSLDQACCTIQPEDSVIVTVTWTPVEEGGVRELLSFVANGIIKHQAILLGKAEATKKKKKSLWDSIKSKRDLSTPSKVKKVASMPVKAANKTFHVSRQPQYKRNGGSNPLSSLNQDRASRRSSGSKDGKGQSACPQILQDLPKSVKANLENMPPQKNSPLVLLVPADKLLDASDKAERSCLPLPKEVRLLNKTLSPISTPERFSNPLTSRFQSPLPVIGKTANNKHQEPGTPTLSMKDALAIIESDLTSAVSPPNACSSFNFSDSLESENQNAGCEPEEAMKTVENVSPQTDTAQPRLTFFVKSNKALDEKSGSDAVLPTTAAFCSATVTKCNNRTDDNMDQKGLKSKKMLFDSATVTKSKLEMSLEHSPGSRKIRTSRRRLLERTPSLSDHSNVESNTGVPPGVCPLPVINCDVDVEFKLTVTSPQNSPQRLMPHQPTSLDRSSTSTFSAPLQPISDVQPNLNGTVSFDGHASETLPSCVSLDLFPVHSRASNPTKKRKSEEFSKDCLDDSAKSFQVKKSCVLPQDPKKPCHEKRFSARSGQTQYRPTVPANSRKSTKVPPRKSCPKQTQQGGQSVKSFSASKVKTAKVIAVAQSRLNFIKPAQTAIPRHPLPFAAKNMFYDERWIEKQERGFTWWMNYVLTPDDFKVATEVAKVNALSLTMGNEKLNIPKAPTKEEMSFRTYTARRRLNRLRRAACQLFTSDSMVKAIQRLELEVEAKRLLVRKDRHLWKDIGERQKVLNWLLSYNPLWLRIGLETIFGELIPLESNSDVMGLAMFILGRLLWNPDIAAEFRHPKVPHLYRDGHEEALSRFTLKKLLLLVCFLDKAKESRLIEHDPCLFCMDAEFKATKDMLLAFARDFLSGEGILSRHLNLLGLPVSHVQTPLAEFSFAVQNLAVDLRCGIRLVRIMELFTQDWSLSSKLRMPAISRLQKVHNVDISLKALREKGIDLKDEHGATIDSRDIVDGHREKTLNLLWKIIFTFQVEVLLDMEQLKEEISFLKKTWRTKQKLALLKADKCAVRSSNGSPRSEQSSAKLTLLLDWVNAVCEFYSLKAENFTVSFSDGRILCYLIHHYHPNHLRAENIHQKTTQTIECDQRGKVELNNSSSDSDCSFDSLEQNGSPAVDFKVLLEHEKSNFQLVNTAVSYLGGVPAMITPEDMSNTIPNEKVVTCYLSFLCARLLDLRNETRAARVIQSAWRRYKLQKDMQLIKQRNLAACKIQALVKSFLQKRRLKRRDRAATIIQAFWRGYSAQRDLRRMKEAKLFAIQNSAAILIQKTYRGWRTRAYLKKSHACVIIQTAFRKWHMRKMTRRNAAALRIQAWYRMQHCKRQYLTKKSTAVHIQAWFRGTYQRHKFQTLKKRHQSAIVIQSAFRAFVVRKQIAEMKQAAVVIQTWYHACLLRNAERRRYLEMKTATVTLQAAVRGWKARREMARWNQAALVIQTAYRRFISERYFLSLRRSVVIVQQRYRAKVVGERLGKEYQSLKHATVKIQALWRGRAERKKIDQLHRCATVIQSNYRRYVLQTKFFALKQAALVIQRRYKAFRMGKKIQTDFLETKKAAIVLQSAYRGMKARQEMVKKRKAATLIQAAVRAFACRQKFLAQKNAAITIQQRYRAHILKCMEKGRYLQLRQSAIKLQAFYRGCRARRELKRKHQAATVIQACFRMYKARVSYLAAKCATIIIQQRYRAYISGRHSRASYLRMKTAAVNIQSAFRGMKVRRKLKKMHLAATRIQACFRGHSQLLKYRRQKWAASVIQRRYQANKLKTVVEERYVAMKKAALCIQAAYRGMRSRQQIAEMQMAARLIQRRYRAYKQHGEFHALRQASIIIQRRYRAKLLTKQQRERYCSMQKAAISLQAAYRGMSVRREIRKRHEAATVLQAWYRMYKVRMAFQAMRLAAVLIQRHYRCHLERKEARGHFLKLRRSAIVVQAVFRGTRTRREICKWHSAATVIQRKYLACKERKSFLSIKAAVVRCQQKWRAVLASRQERKAYLAKRNAVVAIQAAFRGMKVRRRVQIERKAAITIQSHVRKHISKRNYQRLLWATRTIQRRYRANQMMKQDMQSLKERKRAAVVLQAAFRGMKARHTLKRKHKAAVVLQSTYRARCARTRYLCMRYAAVAIQQRYRSTIAARNQREHFLKLRCASICLQATFRGQKARREIGLQHQAATLIQASFRRHREVTKFQAMRVSAIIIQRHFRSYVEAKGAREGYLTLKKSAILIQATFRGYSVRQRIAQMHKAATTIQAAFRMHKQRSAFKRQCWAASVLQGRFSAWRCGHQQRQRYLQLKEAAICLQKSFRGKMARDLAKRIKAARIIQSYLRMSIQRKKFLKAKAAVVLIQSAYRGRYCRTQYARMQKSAVLIQQWYRSRKLVRKQRDEFKAVQKATLTLQCALRRMAAMRLAKRRRAAVKIQSVLRMHVHRSRYLRLRSCAVMLQARHRMCTVRRTYRRYQAAALTVQTFYRAYRAKLEQRQRYLRTLKCVRTLQAHVRGFIQYRRFQRMRESAVTIQACYRGMIERRKFQHLKKSVCLIQMRYQAYQLCQRERTQYLKLRNSAILIQAGFRAYRTRKHKAQTRAAVQIQAWFRGCQARRDYMSKQAAVATIHRCLQARLQRARFRAIQHSVQVIQQRWRETLTSRKLRADYLRIKSAAVKVQAFWRGSVVRRSIRKERNAAVQIQSAFRGYRQRQAFKQKKASVLLLQRRFRALLLAKAAKESLRKRNAAAITIQAFCHGWLTRQRVKEAASAIRRHRFIAAAYHHLCAVKIQRALRAHWALKAAKRQISSVIYIQRWFKAKLQRKRYLEQRQNIITVQRAVKAWLNHRHQAAAVIQHATKRFLLRRKKERLQQGIVKVQALWRGHCSRKLHDTTKVISLRNRFRKVNREAKEEDKLCNKTATALSYLLGYQNYAYILAALKHLETATRLSPECCERLVNSGATHTIFTLIRSCNRSVPSMEIITLAIQVLLNLSKYNKTIDAVYEVPDSVDTLLDLLQIYREKAGDKVADKGGSIFTKACFLLVILVQDERRATGVKKLPRASERICSIYKLTLRKYKMDVQRTKVKQRMNVSLNGSFLPQATPQKSKPTARFAPDWVLHRGKMKDIVDPLGAIQMLVKALALMP
ncbi:abnormal spindle-like microcephaly-associated protein [Salminus brasiliensis]|uniref:abnormal spindle-like microcephaly-associated protein n=1 Tax=Salminus brasiliensis TaxID=930266 RepID=UPI003B82EE60